MEYSITKAKLGNDLLYKTLAALSRCMSEIGLDLYVVGATARDITMKLMSEEAPKRGTVDLDVAIAIEDWNTFDVVSETLERNHFKRINNTQKFYYQGESGEIDFEVDVVPFGGIAVGEEICWPPDGNPVMSVKCFQDVMKDADTVIIENTVKLYMAPLCGQFLIKLDTWNDRNDLTDKDAEDMMFILKNYFDIRIYKQVDIPPDVVTFDDDSEVIDMGTQWLAYDIGKMLTTEHLHFYDDLITAELEKEEGSPLIIHSMNYYGYPDNSDTSSYYEPCRKIWTVFRSVLRKELSKRESI